MTWAASASSGWYKTMRDAPGLRWMEHRLSFAVGMPVLTLFGLATSLLIPRFVDPVQFGVYALLLNLFRYAGRGDLGLAQLADRRIAARPGVPDEAEVARLIECRLVLGLASLVTLLPLAVIWAAWSGWASPLDAALATAAGTASMIAGGPSSIFRARGWIWEYTALGFFFCIGFIVPRLLGLLLDGVTGCFLALLLWYGAVVICLHLRQPPLSRFRVASRVLRSNLTAALPLFAFAAAWTLYLSANRWIAACLSTPRDLGLFSIGANLALTGVTTLGGIADVHYPRWLMKLGASRTGSHSDVIAKEALAVSAVVSIAVLAFVPLAGHAIKTIFPAYVGSAPATVALAIGCIPLAVVAWFLPVAIAVSRRPTRDALLVFGPATAVLIVGMTVGGRMAGIEGQSWGCCASGLAALVGIAAVLIETGILNLHAAGRFVLLPAAMVAALAGVAWAAGPHEDLAMLKGSGTGPAATAPPAGWHLVFQDDFHTLSLWDGTKGNWLPFYPWGGHTNPSSHELEYYIDPRNGAAPLSALNPYSIDGEGLTITARFVPQQDRQSTHGMAYASGLLNGLHRFSFTYGYVEMRAKMPKGRGLWPAFWLLPSAQRWPPEIDVVEIVDGGAGRYWATLHAGVSKAEKIAQAVIDTGDLHAGFHDYGVLWTASEIAWYFDGRRVASTATPAGFDQPMYVLVNLAVGGDWPGPPDQATDFPASMTIAWIRVFQAPGGEHT
jgi:beta-glucanase (GH16 family)